MAIDDIPEARRDQPTPDYSSQGAPLFWLVGAMVSLAIGIILWLALRPPVPNSAGSSPSSTAQIEQGTSAASESSDSAAATDSGETGTGDSEDSDELQPDSILGHTAYEEAPPEALVPLTEDGRIQMREAAAIAFRAMVDAARAEGIYIEPVSGFRSMDDQEYLFFEVKANRVETASERAEVSAPPGYSEHHTGYAIDVIDPDWPDTDLEETFENTPAFQWMEANAARYGFELSFPKDNTQGVTYEPWHWRYVGDRDSLEVFYKNKQQPVEQDGEDEQGGNQL